MRCRCTILLFTLLPLIINAQSLIDSLKKELALSKPDTNRVSILSELSIGYLQSNADSSTKYAQEGLTLARILKFKSGEADCLRRSGIVQFYRGRYPEALDIFQQALKISESIGHSFGIAASFGHIGDIYEEQGEYLKARSYYRRHLKIAESIHSKREMVLALTKIGDSYMEQNYLDSASMVIDQAFEMIKDGLDMRIGGLIWKDLGQLEAKKENGEQAMNFFRQAITYATVSNSFNSLNQIFLGIADLYHRAGEPDSCIFYAKEALAAGQKNNYAKGIIAASKLLSEVYASIDEHEAFKYLKIATAVKDSLFNTAKASQVQNLFFLEHQRQQALEAARTKYKNQFRLYALLFVLGILLLLAIILYQNNRNKQKANDLLQKQKQEILQQRANAERALEELKITQQQLIQSEKMASLGELTAGIAHEIQNPLNFVNNFSEINSELVEELKSEAEKGNVEEVKSIADDLKENNQKITFHGKRADSIVKGMLQHSRTSTGKKELTDINALADEFLRLSYHGLRAKDKSFNAAMETNFDYNLEKIEVIPQDIGRVLLNLFNNAFYSVNEKKKALNGLFEPKVFVSTEKMNGKVQIIVRDNGNGIPQKILDKIYQPFFTTKPTGEGTGLGLSLSYDIITKGHNGDLKVETKEGEYAMFKIILPIENKN